MLLQLQYRGAYNLYGEIAHKQVKSDKAVT